MKLPIDLFAVVVSHSFWLFSRFLLKTEISLALASPADSASAAHTRLEQVMISLRIRKRTRNTPIATGMHIAIEKINSNTVPASIEPARAIM